MQTSPRQCHLCVAPIFILMDFTCITEQENVSWSQKSCFSWALSRTGSHPRAAAFPREEQTRQLEDASSGAAAVPGRSGHGEQGLIAAGSAGAGGHWQHSHSADPIPGTAQTLLAAPTWAQQGAELCLCVLQSQLSGDERDGG